MRTTPTLALFSPVDWQWFAVGVLYLLLAVALVFAAKLALVRLTPYRLDRELFEHDNPAMGVAVAGYFAAVIAVFLGVTIVPGRDAAALYAAPPHWPGVLGSLGAVALWTLGGIAALNLSRLTSDRLILGSVRPQTEITRDRNVGVGAAEAGCLLASGLVVAGALNGEGNVLTAIVFFLLGQAALVAFAWAYRHTAGFDVMAELRGDNHAAGVALALNLIALGVVLMRAVAGDFEGWPDSLARFGIYAVVGPLALIGLRRLVDVLLVPRTSLAHEIARDRSLSAALVEGTLAVGVAAVAFFVL